MPQDDIETIADVIENWAYGYVNEYCISDECEKHYRKLYFILDQIRSVNIADVVVPPMGPEAI